MIFQKGKKNPYIADLKKQVTKGSMLKQLVILNIYQKVTVFRIRHSLIFTCEIVPKNIRSLAWGGRANNKTMPMLGLLPSHELDYLAGTWREEDAKAFKENTRYFEKIDKDLWAVFLCQPALFE